MKLVRVFPNLSAENKSAYRNRQEAIITCISPVFYLISRNDNQADKMKIIADNTVPYLKGILEPIADVSYLDSKEFTPTNIKDADALIVRSIDKCTRELLEGSRVRPSRQPRSGTTISISIIARRQGSRGRTPRVATPLPWGNMYYPLW